MNQFSVLITGLLCCLAVSISAQPIVGKWKFEFPTEEGTLIMSAEIKADGTYSLDMGNDGTVEGTGKYTSSGNDVYTVNDDQGDCTGKGVYKMTVSGSTLTMKRISDECPNRSGPEGVMTAKRM